MSDRNEGRHMIERMGKRVCRRGLGCLVLLLVASSTACQQTRTSDKNLAFVSPDEGMKLIGERKGVLGIGKSAGGVWVDCRSPAAYVVEHIPGAVNMPYETARKRHVELNPYDFVIVYGESYNSPDALGMSKTLIELKHDHVRTLRGGLRAWTDAGLETESGLGDS